MKKLNLLLCGMALSSLLFVSCGEDILVVDVDPTLTVTPAEGVEAVVGEVVTFKVIAGSDQNIVSIKFSPTSVGGEGTSTDSIFDADAEKHSITMDYDYTVPEGVTTVTIKFEVRDDKDLSATESRVITVVSAAGPITTYSSTVLGANNNTTGSSFASFDGSIYTLAEAKENSDKVDFIYFYGDTNKATLASPDDSDLQTVFSSVSGWTTINATRFATTTLTSDQFDAIIDDATIVTEANAASETKVNELAVDDVIAFKTSGDKLGLAKITALEESNTGTMTIDVKVQE
jgi:hypothetical protein